MVCGQGHKLCVTLGVKCLITKRRPGWPAVARRGVVQRGDGRPGGAVGLFTPGPVTLASLRGGIGEEHLTDAKRRATEGSLKAGIAGC